MRIGLLFALDNKTVLDFLEESDHATIIRNCAVNNAPSVNTLMISLLKAGHFIRIFTFAKEDFVVKARQVEIFAVKPVDNYFVKYSFGCFADSARLRKVLRKNYEDLEVIHAHWTYAYAYAALSLTTVKPVYVTVRDWASYIWKIESTKNKVFWTFRVLMNEIVMRDKRVRFIANSPYTAVRIKKKLNLDVPVIPNSIMDGFVSNTEHKNPEIFTILCISSSNDRRKNVATLLRAFQSFRKKIPNCRLVLIGPPFVDGSPAITSWNNKGLLDNVTLLGAKPHEELKTFLDASTVFVTPSLEETFGNTLLESIARKVPVIGGENSGAIPYVLHHGKTGLLCDVGSPSAIEEKLEYVFDNPNEMKKLTEEAYSIITNEYSEQVVCEKHIRLYENGRKYGFPCGY